MIQHKSAKELDCMYDLTALVFINDVAKRAIIALMLNQWQLAEGTIKMAITEMRNGEKTVR